MTKRTRGPGAIVVGAVCALVVGMPVGSSDAATRDPSRALFVAASATRDAPSFVATLDESGEGTTRVVYQAPDRFHSLQSGARVATSIIQIGHDHYQGEGVSPSSWTHNVLPEGELGWGSLFKQVFDTVTTAKKVSRAGDEYRFALATGTGTAVVDHGYLVSVDVRTTVDPGSPRHRKVSFKKIGSAPAVRPPVSGVEDKPPDGRSGG